MQAILNYFEPAIIVHPANRKKGASTMADGNATATHREIGKKYRVTVTKLNRDIRVESVDGSLLPLGVYDVHLDAGIEMLMRNDGGPDMWVLEQ